MKRILYIESNTDGTVGGSYFSLLYLIQGLDKKKYEPHVMFYQDNILVPEFKKVTPYVYIENKLDPAVSMASSRFADIIKSPYWLFTDVLMQQKRVRSLIKKIRPDLVHINDGYHCCHDWILGCFLNNIRVVAHDRGTRAPCSLRTRYFVRFLDAIIAVSESYKNNVIRQKLKPKRACRVYNGLDLEGRMSGVAQDDTSIRSELHIKKEAPVVGIVGNVDKWKGQHIVLSAIKEVKKSYPEIKCLIAGAVCKGAEGYKTKLDHFISTNGLEGNIVFLGFRKDIPQVMQALNVLIHASVEPEPFARVILEGMALAKPIIGTNSGGTQEQIIDKTTGLLVAMNDSIEMSNAIIYYLDDAKRAEEIGRKGRQRLLDLFSIRNMVDDTEKIYQNIFDNYSS